MDQPEVAPRSWARVAAWLGLPLALTAWGLLRHPRTSRGGVHAPPSASAAAADSAPAKHSLPRASDSAEPRGLSLPSGAPTRISCADAQKVTRFLQRELAAPAIAPTPAELSREWASLLDPHGLWSAAPDSPVQAELLGAAPDMLASLHDHTASCGGADEVARVWQPFQQRLLAIYDQAYESARSGPKLDAAQLFQLVAEPIFEDDPVTRPAVDLASELGRRIGALVGRFPEQAAAAEQARARFFPTDREQLSQIAVLAALRAYVPLVDPHGDFAPLDEEWALYAGDDTLDAGSPLWRDVTRTPLGARIGDDPAAPLALDDLVLSINGLTLAGASIDQIEQAARSAHGKAFELQVLRQGEPKLLRLRVDDAETDEAGHLELERIRYGRDDRNVLRVSIPDVTDALGDELSEVLEHDATDASAVLLDLRGNGGGSLDAAVESLALFLPGAKLFPLIHRGAVTEVLQARRPEHPYAGPVAALVDGDTASAAEMLAGALQAYGRGVVIGARTFGKGCVQEYFDDVVGSGVLRMTTLQFVMPSGDPLQQIGLSPDLRLPLPEAGERESQITRQPITFDGPDVRDRSIAFGPAWPKASAAPGPCDDAVVCLALGRLSGVKPGKKSRAPALSEAAARSSRARAGTR